MKILLKISLIDLFVVLAAILLLLPSFATMANDPGLGWHLASGAMIIESGWQAPRYDPFIYAERPIQWVADQWLGSALFALVYKYLAWEGLYALTFLSFILCFFPLMYSTAFRQSGSCFASLIATVICLRAAQLHFIIRPLILSLVLFAVFCFLLYRLRDRLLRKESIWFELSLLPPLFLLWANIHPYFLLGLVIFATFLAGLIWDQFVLKRYLVTVKRWLALLVTLALAAGATLINPYGIELYQNILSLTGNDFFTNLMSEWQPLDFNSGEGKIFQFMVGVVIFAAIFSEDFRKKWGFIELLIVGGLLHFTLGSVRGLPLLAIYLIPILASALQSLGALAWFNRFSVVNLFRRLSKRANLYEARTDNSLVAYLLVLLLFVGAIGTGQFGLIYSGDKGPSRDIYPYKAVDLLLEDMLPDQKKVVFNNLDWGGFIAWRGEGKIQYLFDDRLTLFPEERFRQYVKLQRSLEELPKFFDLAEGLLVQDGSSLDRLLTADPRFKEAYRDSIAVIYEVNVDYVLESVEELYH